MKNWCSAERIRRATWFAVTAACGVTSLVATWNELAANAGASSLRVGKPLFDEEQPSAPRFDWHRLASHDYQADFQRFATLSIPERRPLVRLHNEILFSFFDTSPRSNIIIGRDHHMVDRLMVDGYCHRDLADYLPRMHERVVQLRALQEHFEARQRAFLFVITPSKMARMPETFLDRVDCPASPADRDSIIPVYTKMLADAGIHFVDAASLVDDLRKTGISSFPVGGVHWNMLGAAYATQAIIRRLNQTNRKPLLPEMRWTTHALNGPIFEDDDLAVGLNLLHERSYPSTYVEFAPEGPCPSGKLSITLIASSCGVQLVRALSETQCVARGRYFARLTSRYVTFPPALEVARGPLGLDFIKPLLDADIVILEEHENMATLSRHVTAFYKLALEDEPIGAAQEARAAETGVTPNANRHALGQEHVGAPTRRAHQDPE